jgi:Na+/proline symporter
MLAITLKDAVQGITATIIIIIIIITVTVEINSGNCPHFRNYRKM